MRFALRERVHIGCKKGEALLPETPFIFKSLPFRLQLTQCLAGRRRIRKLGDGSVVVIENRHVPRRGCYRDVDRLKTGGEMDDLDDLRLVLPHSTLEGATQIARAPYLGTKEGHGERASDLSATRTLE